MKRIRNLVAVVAMMILMMSWSMVTMGADKVKGFRQTDATPSSVTLQWDKVTGAENYYIYESIRYAYAGKKIGQTTGTSFTIQGLNSDTTYGFVISTEPLDDIEAVNIYSTYVTAATVSQKVTSVTIKHKTNRKIQLFWDEKTSASGYEIQIQNYKGKKIEAPILTSQGMANINSITGDQFYKIRLRSYVQTVNGKKYSAAAELITANNNTTKVKSKGNYLQLTWKKVKGATSYTIYGKQGNNIAKSGCKKIGTAKKNKFKVTKLEKKKLKKGKNYYFYVVANRKVKGKTYKSLVKRAYGCRL